MTDKMTAEQFASHEFWQLGKVDDGRAMILVTEGEYNAIRQALTAPKVPDNKRLCDLLAALDRAKMLSLEIVNGCMLAALTAPRVPEALDADKLHAEKRALDPHVTTPYIYTLRWVQGWNACREALLTAAPAPAEPVAPRVPDVDALAQIIREVDGDHSLGAGALAEAIIEKITAAPAPAEPTISETFERIGREIKIDDAKIIAMVDARYDALLSEREGGGV
jgi:hypothetical protein